jgi:hypothetical protein
LPNASEATSPVQGKGKSKATLPKDDALGIEAIVSQLSNWAKEKENSPLTVAVVGLANVSVHCKIPMF